MRAVALKMEVDWARAGQWHLHPGPRQVVPRRTRNIQVLQYSGSHVGDLAGQTAGFQDTALPRTSSKQLRASVTAILGSLHTLQGVTGPRASQSESTPTKTCTADSFNSHCFALGNAIEAVLAQGRLRHTHTHAHAHTHTHTHTCAPHNQQAQDPKVSAPCKKGLSGSRASLSNSSRYGEFQVIVQTVPTDECKWLCMYACMCAHMYVCIHRHTYIILYKP